MPKIIMTHSENSAVGLYRIWMQAKYLQELGWEVVRFADKPPALTVRDWETISVGADIIVCQRTDSPDLVAVMLGMGDLRNCPVVYESDDDIFDVSTSSHAYQYFYPGSPLRDMCTLFMEHADALTVSTPGLADSYSKLNSNIYILKNCQDLDMWKGIKNKKPAKDKGKIVIGWQGSSTHYDDLHLIRRPLKKLLRNYPNVIFRVFGIMPDFLMDHSQVDITAGKWVDAYDWPKKMASLGFDIGIAPVVQRPFNIGKSNIKWQEYSMLEIPTIASNIAEYKEIEHGVTGLLARDETEWYAMMERLVNSEELRRELGQNAKQYVTKNLSIKENITKWDEAYRQIISDYKTANERR